MQIRWTDDAIAEMAEVVELLETKVPRWLSVSLRKYMVKPKVLPS